MTLKVLIADDEVRLARKLSERLLKCWPEIDEIIMVHDGKAALEAIEKYDLKVAFLDIKMPEMTGLEVAWHIKEKCHVVFVTAYNEHAIEAFEIGILDYLVKPASLDRIDDAVLRIKGRLSSKPLNMKKNLGKIKHMMPLDYLRYIKASSGATMFLIPVGDVLFFSTEGRYTQVKTKDKSPLTNFTLKELGSMLDPEKFWRVRGAMIVNITKVEKIEIRGRDNTKLYLTGVPEPITVSRVYAGQFKKI